MSAGYFNTIMDQGSMFLLQLTCLDPSNNPIDLTGLECAMQLRSLPEDDSYVLDLTTQNGDIIISGAQGIIQITASSTQTGAVIPGPYYYDIILTNPANNSDTRIVQGQIEVNAEVTR